MAQTIGIDIGSGLIKIAVIKNNKLHKMHAIETGDRDPKFILHEIKQFLRRNKIKLQNVNVMVKDYKTRRIKMERIRRYELKNALLFEREEKIGTSEILGENYKDNHIIQRKTNKIFDILLAVINEEEINKYEEILNSINITDKNFFMECFLYSDIVGDNSVIIDVGYSSIQIMFFDRGRILKTSLLKKGLKDILADIKNKLQISMSSKDLMQALLDNQNDEKHNILTWWINLFTENIINIINTFAHENSKTLTGMNIYYTGGIFSVSKMVDYFNHLMGVEGRVLKVYGHHEEPLFNNSIALAYKTGSKGMIERGHNKFFKIAGIIASYIMLSAITNLLVFGGYNTYSYLKLNEKIKSVQNVYDERKFYYDSLNSEYSQLSALILKDNEQAESYREPNDLSKMLADIKTTVTSDVTIQSLELDSHNKVLIQGTVASYTSLGVFSTQLKRIFNNVTIKEMERENGRNITYRLECTF